MALSSLTADGTQRGWLGLTGEKHSGEAERLGRALQAVSTAPRRGSRLLPRLGDPQSGTRVSAVDPTPAQGDSDACCGEGEQPLCSFIELREASSLLYALEKQPKAEP